MSRLLIVTCILLAGCTTPAPTEPVPDPSPQDDPAAEAAAFPAAAQHCQDTVAFFLQEPAHYQAMLPANVTTRDAEALTGLGLPAGSGQAAAYVSGYDCPATDLAAGRPMQGGEVAILIEPPLLDPAPDLPAATLDFYLMNWHANGSLHLERLAAMGVPATHASVDVAFESTLASHRGTIRVHDANGTLASYGFTALEADPYTGLVRIWHQNEAGVAAADLVFDAAPNGKGAVTDCTFRDVYAAVFGGTTCPQPGLALAFYDQSYDGGLVFLPGARILAG